MYKYIIIVGNAFNSDIDIVYSLTLIYLKIVLGKTSYFWKWKRFHS